MNNGQKAIKIFAICLAVLIIANIFSAVIYGLSFLTFLDPNDKKIETNFEQVYQNVNEILIDSTSSDIIIQPGSSFKVEATSFGTEFSSKLVERKLIIDEPIKWLLNKERGTIVITVPSTVLLHDLEINSGAGKIKIESINSQNFELDQGAGVVEIFNSKFNDTQIDGGAGKIDIKNSILNDLDLSAGVGKVTIDGDITGDSNVECGVGETNIELNKSIENYTLRVEKGLGKIIVNGEEVKNETVLGAGINRLEIEGGVGNITVDFE